MLSFVTISRCGVWRRRQDICRVSSSVGTTGWAAGGDLGWPPLAAGGRLCTGSYQLERHGFGSNTNQPRIITTTQDPAQILNTHTMKYLIETITIVLTAIKTGDVVYFISNNIDITYWFITNDFVN